MSQGKVIVTGASGMLGGWIYRHLLQEGIPCEGWSRATDRAPDGTTFDRGLASYTDSISDATLVIHCAAMTDADYCESNLEEAKFVNALWSGALAREAALTGARFIYVSTDAVYDGNAPGRRREYDEPNPINVYAATKLQGEQAVLDAYPAATVVRTTMVGWTLPGKREKFAEQIIRNLLSGERLQLFRDAIFSPLHVADLGTLLLRLAETEYSGILNIGSCDGVSKAAFGRMVAEDFGYYPSPIVPVSVDDVPLPAKRTKNTMLDVSRATDLLGYLPNVPGTIRGLRRDFHDGTVERLKGGPWP